MLKPANRVILITGANRGIGKAIAAELTTQGYRLSLGVRDPASIDASQYNADTLVHAWDALSPTDSKTWVDAVMKQYGRIDGLVLNAGVMHPGGIRDADDESLDAMWAVNFKGPLRLIRAAMPALAAGGSGRVANIVSLGGKRVLAPANLGYSASKFAALALTHALRQEGWDDGIRATAICPGLVETDMTNGVEPGPGQFKLTPESIAATTAYALSLPNEASVAEILVNSRLELAM